MMFQIKYLLFRLCFAAGRVGHMIECFSYIHIRRMTPAPAVILQVSCWQQFIQNCYVLKVFSLGSKNYLNFCDVRFFFLEMCDKLS